MNTKDEDMEVVYTSAYNPFPEPQTIPSGWDTSGFFSVPEPFDLAQGKLAPDTESNASAEN